MEVASLFSKFVEYRPVLLPKIAYSTKVFAEIIWNFPNCYFDEFHFYEFILCQEGNTNNGWSSYYHIFSKGNKWLMTKYRNFSYFLKIRKKLQRSTLPRLRLSHCRDWSSNYQVVMRTKPFKRERHKMVKHTQTIECVWPFCRVGA